MKKILITAVLCALPMLLVGCGSKHYTITKADGSTVTSAGEPEFVKASNTYKFENLDGQDVILKREDIKEIIKNKE
ncbi:YgdI/YgdR family lipoprotein [Maridesulfovibrio zosterae]|uniref:YgdI/YgdR family lipoprotein n=1 Tax=Maridesulfovibrio zosterae TaxID=82171 RepID=UPI000403DA3E|nr:YgdI/YgdR family lipoprotein [Maridesulfovibrio zosterae]